MSNECNVDNYRGGGCNSSSGSYLLFQERKLWAYEEYHAYPKECLP